MSKAINVNESSIIDLKAELFRKEEKFRQDHTSRNEEKPLSKGSKTLEKLAALTGKKRPADKRKLDNAAIKSEATVSKNEDSAEFEKAKIMLEAKARLYDKMSRGEVEDPEEDEDSSFLVDFHKKVYGKESDGHMNENVTSEDEWVEFEDSLGRHRKCMKKDLERFKELDAEFRPKERTPSPPPLLPEDARREMMKEKWAAEQEELSRNLDRDIHYQNVLFDEVRDHGVAYYQFSKDETERKSQMDTLNQLREQTVQQRAKREQIKAKRQAALSARLAKIKQKKLQTQEMGSAEEGEDLGDVKNEPMIEPNVGEIAAGESLVAADNKEEERLNDSTLSIRRLNEIPGRDPVSTGSPVWKTLNRNSALTTENLTPEMKAEGFTIKRKDAKLSYKQWIASSREERNDEFAPPVFYHDAALQSTKSNRRGTRTNQSS